ncbi:MAG: glycosyltransferase [Rikenellaceae bacterium]
MKALYITFIAFKAGNGITKKVKAQFKAFVKGGMDMRLSYFFVSGETKYYKIGSEQIRLGSRLQAALHPKVKFNALIEYIKKNQITFLYIRYTSNASASYLNFLQEAKKMGVRIYLEIPTYPYDGECNTKNPYKLFTLYREKIYRKRLHKFIDRVITFSDDDKIFNIKTINISNAVDFDSIELRTIKPNHNYIKFVAVATIGFWHGYDRIIRALAKYNNRDEIYIDIVGVGPALEELKELVTTLKIDKYVTFYGAQHGETLNKIFNDADICIGSLGRHRSGVNRMKALKSVEYAARGIPFIYSEQNDDFDHMPYIYKVSPDEAEIDIGEIINSLNYKNFNPIEIRNSAAELSWNTQITKITSTLKQ